MILLIRYFYFYFAFVEVSATCGIRNIPEVNNKIVKQKKYQNLDIHTHGKYCISVFSFFFYFIHLR